MRRPAAWPSAAILAATLLAAAPVHAARGVNLTWSRCHGEGVGTQNRAFACDTNSGEEVLVASFELDSPLAQVTGNEVIVDLVSQDDPLPAWWDLWNAGACRQTSLTMNLVESPGDVVCVNWQGGVSAGGIGAYSTQGPYPPTLASRHRRMVIALAVPPDALADLLANTEYFSCNIVVDHAKILGTGACAGCSGSVCLVLASLNVITPILANNVLLIGGTVPDSATAHWQGTSADCRIVPVRDATWGQVKALYR